MGFKVSSTSNMQSTLKSVVVGENRNDVIKSPPNSTIEDNLGNLPNF